MRKQILFLLVMLTRGLSPCAFNLYMSGYISDLNGENWDKMDFYDIKVGSLNVNHEL